jgi:hypothetical protein
MEKCNVISSPDERLYALLDFALSWSKVDGYEANQTHLSFRYYKSSIKASKDNFIPFHREELHSTPTPPQH